MLAADSIDIDRPASDIRLMAVIPYLPNLVDWPEPVG